MLWGNMWNYIAESFSQEEKEILSRYFTNFDKPVFALINLPEVVKGALFARYSRSAKSLRRLFLDEFYTEIGAAQGGANGVVGLDRAESLYERMLSEYGDDSVAQLGGVHLACEQASNVLTKVLERGRLMAYLEQSTRYIPYDKPMADGHFKYLVPDEIISSGLESEYRSHMDQLFAGYKIFYAQVESKLFESTSKDANDSEFVYKSSVRAVALDAARGVLPASVLSNVGIFASAQAYESLILRMRAHSLLEVQQYAQLIKNELDKVIPAFLTRVDRSDRGGVWVDYLSERRSCLEDYYHKTENQTAETNRLPVNLEADGVNVNLISFDEDGERRVAAAILFECTDLGMSDSLKLVSGLSDSEVKDLYVSYVGNRSNRRHKPGRSFEHTRYLFEIDCDYGAFRDLQRHRMLTIEWQDLGVNLGYAVPELIRDFGFEGQYRDLFDKSNEFYHKVKAALGAKVASYVVPMGYRVKFVMDLNAREAMHLIELRSSPQGHVSYRKVAQEMYKSIVAIGHRNIARSIKYVDMDQYRLGRLSSLRQEERKSQELST